ncbi:MAG TPA: tetratricopeptide repeat protein [Burkholderiales bacterium]|nr:tetratricopeptide repeat protein [Burkholderiales bacterium]
MPRLTTALFALMICAGTGASGAASPRGKTVDPLNRVRTLVAAVIVGDEVRVQHIAAELREQPRPPRGDRRVARDLNERGLALWQRQRFDEAAVLFRQAHAADASDAEIAENLGYSLLKSGQVASAETALLAALALAPERASAWGSLGLVYAKQDKHREGVAAVLTAYRYTRDPKRTLDVYSRLATTDDDPKVRAVLADVVSRLSKPS